MNFKTSSLIASAIIVSSFMTTPVFARDALSSSFGIKTVALKNGETLHVFADGKMAREDKYGRASLVKSGETLETTDGQKIALIGNEVARLDQLLIAGHESRSFN